MTLHEGAHIFLATVSDAKPDARPSPVSCPMMSGCDVEHKTFGVIPFSWKRIESWR
ncbi:MAG: hypothetical protein IJG55_00650 [Synergistaceae bacterium]|nr:hypothetical protein [Synergistaceae bacterium]